MRCEAMSPFADIVKCRHSPTFPLSPFADMDMTSALARLISPKASAPYSDCQ
jgi:hypothetical protein